MLGDQLWHFPGRIGAMARDLASIRVLLVPAADRVAAIERQLDVSAADIREMRATLDRVEGALADVLEEMPTPGNGPLARAKDALTPGD